MLLSSHMSLIARDEKLWEALVDPTRRRILDILRHHAQTTGQLSSVFPQSRYAIMKHLTVLEEAGLLSIRRDGRERWNSINVTPLRRMYERWLTPYQQLWASSLSRLGALVEEEQVAPMTDTGFGAVRHASIDQITEIAGTPQIVFDALTKHVARWWSNISLGGCIFGTIAFELAAVGDGSTELRLSHRMIGEIDDEAAALYRGGWKALIDGGLRAYVETGTEAWSAA